MDYSSSLSGTHVTDYSTDLQINYLIFSYQSRLVTDFTEFSIIITPQLANYSTYSTKLPSRLVIKLQAADQVISKVLEIPELIMDPNSTVFLDSVEFKVKVTYSKLALRKLEAVFTISDEVSYKKQLSGYFHAYNQPQLNLIQLSNKVPEYYQDSRDFQVFLNLIQVMMTDLYSKVGNPLLIMDPEKCDIDILPLLYSYLAVNYNYTYPEELSRTLLKYLPELIKYRGSIRGIKLAISVATLYNDESRTIDEIASVETSGHPECPYPYIYVKIYSDTVNLQYVSDLIELVRPAGTFLTIQRAVSITGSSEIDFYDSGIPRNTMTIYVDNDNLISNPKYYDEYGRDEFLEKMMIPYQNSSKIEISENRPTAISSSPHASDLHSLVGFSQVSEDGEEFKDPNGGN